MDKTRQLTVLLQAAGQGDQSAEHRVLGLLYDELRAMAGARLKHAPPHRSLQATVLVHEAYLRIFEQQQISFEGRRHFFFAASRAMRDILVEHARRGTSQKRGGDRQRIELRYEDMLVEADTEKMLVLDEALQQLEEIDSEAAQLVNLRYFSGLNMQEAAEYLELSLSGAERKWRFARAWLQQALGSDEPTPNE